MDLQSMESVSMEPLKEGLTSICSICVALMEAEVDAATDKCSNYKQIRKHIEHAEECLTKSETIVKEKLRSMDRRMEQLTNDKSSFERQKKDKSLAMDKLHLEKKSAEESLKNSQAALEQAKRHVELTKDELKRENDRKNTGENVAIAGGALLAIPVFGWIAGAIMLSEGLSVRDNASKAISDAEDELRENESRVNENRRRVSNYQSEVCAKQNEIKKTDKVLDQIHSQIKDVKQHLEATADVQEMVRKSVNLLGVLSGRVTAVERQTKRFILWGPVIRAMEDVMKAAGNVAENRLLHSQGMQGFISSLREKVNGVLALCNSSSNSEYDRYY